MKLFLADVSTKRIGRPIDHSFSADCLQRFRGVFDSVHESVCLNEGSSASYRLSSRSKDDVGRALIIVTTTSGARLTVGRNTNAALEIVRRPIISPPSLSAVVYNGKSGFFNRKKKKIILR